MQQVLKHNTETYLTVTYCFFCEKMLMSITSNKNPKSRLQHVYSNGKKKTTFAQMHTNYLAIWKGMSKDNSYMALQDRKMQTEDSTHQRGHQHRYD